jgi:integrase
LHAVFALAERREYRVGNPVRLAKTQKIDRRRPVMLTAAQYDALLHECEANPMLHTYALVLGEAGLRCDSEALWLQWPDIHFDDGYLEIDSGRGYHRTKSGQSRRVPMSPRLAAALRDHAAQFRLGGGPWLFSHGHAERAAGNRIARLRVSFMAAARRAGLPNGFHGHDLRHRAVTLLVEAGTSVTDVQAFAGHADVKTTMRYFRASGQHVDRIRQLWSAPSAGALQAVSAR